MLTVTYLMASATFDKCDPSLITPNYWSGPVLVQQSERNLFGLPLAEFKKKIRYASAFLRSLPLLHIIPVSGSGNVVKINFFISEQNNY